MNSIPNEPRHGTQEPERRSFLTKLSAVSFGTIVAVFPFAAGWGVATGPLQRKDDEAADGASDDGFVRVCPLDSVPADGMPHAFAVVANVADAWTRAVNQRIGEVFLTRTDSGGKPNVTAFTATCPHLGCAVEFDAAEDRYECPCHESGFAKDGTKLFGPSLRGLDPLDTDIRGESGSQEIWVRFERFRAGIAEREIIA
jgi:Rieske Fe-S protein